MGPKGKIVLSGATKTRQSSFPILSWLLQGGVQVDWLPSQYLLQDRGMSAPFGMVCHLAPRLCYTFRSTDVLPDGSQVVLGASWMMNQDAKIIKDVVFYFSLQRGDPF